MTSAKARDFNKNVILFPPKLEQEVLIAEEKNEKIEVNKTTLGKDVKERFARLKRSMRKRSASIL